MVLSPESKSLPVSFSYSQSNATNGAKSILIMWLLFCSGQIDRCDLLCGCGGGKGFRPEICPEGYRARAHGRRGVSRIHAAGQGRDDGLLYARRSEGSVVINL